MNDTLDTLRRLLDEVLELDGRGLQLQADSPLLGALPEFDSLAVVTLLGELQTRFDIEIEDADIDPDIFLTVGSLRAFVEARRAAG